MGTPDQVFSSEARAPPCLMVLAPKYQAKVPLSLTQPTAKYLARIHNFLKERACRAMAPRSLMVLIVNRQVRGRSRINPERSSLTSLQILLCVLQARVFSPRVRGPSRIVLALSFLARILSLTQLGHSCQARVLVSLKELERKDLGRISPSLIVRILGFQVGGHHPIIGGCLIRFLCLVVIN